MGFSITRARAVPTFVVLALLALGGCLLVQPSTIVKDDHQPSHQRVPAGDKGDMGWPGWSR